jgi:hypothetical protein
VPLLDHFHPPLSEKRHWEGFHSKWANALVDDLNQTLLPEGYFAETYVHAGTRVEIDAGTFHGQAGSAARGGATATLPARVWTPPGPTLVLPASFPETFEVQVHSTETGPTLVAAIELISPANKDRPEHRQAFAVKCASYLVQGVGLLLVDIVTSRHGYLHDDLVRLLPDGQGAFPAGPSLYAAAYRPVRREESDQSDAWLSPLAVGTSVAGDATGLDGRDLLAH